MMKAVVVASLTDLRREPVKATHTLHDILQESQLLFGEKVEVLEERGEWCRVSALEQKKFLDGQWVGYPGWVESKDLLFVEEFPETNAVVTALWTEITVDGKTIPVTAGTRLLIEQERVFLPDGREGVIDQAGLSKKNLLDLGRERLGHLYLWGGRSGYDAKRPQSGCDCSGLVNLLYRCQGVDLPRDAHDQYLFCRPIPQEGLKMGDLVFLFGEKDPDRVDHVMLWVEDKLLEATEKTHNVRFVAFDERCFEQRFVCGSPR